MANEEDSVLLTVKRQEDETEIQRLIRESEEEFKPKPAGRCCKDMWLWYICPDPCLQSICDVDHLAAHVFILILGGSIYVAWKALTAQFTAEGANTADSFEFYFFSGIGIGIVLCVWGIVQMIALFNGRMKAAKILDSNNQIREQRFKLDENIQRTNNVRDKLIRTNDRKGQITDEFKKLYLRLRQRQEDMRVLTQINAQIGGIMEDKYVQLLEDIKEQLINSEKGVIKSIYNSMHLRDGVKGLNKTEFVEFVSKLPPNYQNKYELKVENFDQLAGDNKKLDRIELFDLLDKVVEKEVTETDPS